MKILPCHLHPKDKVIVKCFRAGGPLVYDETWFVGCRHKLCGAVAMSEDVAVTRWNEAQKEKGTKA